MSLTSNPFYDLVKPIVSEVSRDFGVVLLIVGSLGIIQCIFLGVRFAKAQDAEEMNQAKKSIRDFVIGFLLIFILMAAMRAGISGLCKWMAENTTVTYY